MIDDDIRDQNKRLEEKWTKDTRVKKMNKSS